jgi:drug/metabolite transporter (DMT)-like permease
MTKATRGLLILLSAAFVWGVGNAVTGITAAKYFSASSLLPAIDISLANTVGGLVFLALVLVVGGWTNANGTESSDQGVPFRPEKQAILAGALKGINTCCFVFSTTYIVATQSLVFESTYILWTVALSAIYVGRRPSLLSITLRALLLCAGVVLVSGRFHDLRHVNSRGVMFGVLAGLSYAGFLFSWGLVTDRLNTFRVKLISTRWLLTISVIAIACLTELVSLLWNRRWWTPFTHLAMTDFMVQTVNGVFVIGVVYLLVTVGMTSLKETREGPSIIAASCLSFSIPFTLLPEFIIGKFVPELSQMIGIGIFMAGFVLMSMAVASSKEVR